MKTWVTVVTTSEYVIGAKVLKASLNKTNTKYSLLALTTNALTYEDLLDLEQYNIKTKIVEPLLLDTLASGDYRQRFAEAGNKLRAFELIEYERIGFLDADTLVCQNIDWILDEQDLIKQGEIAAAFACTCNNRKKPFYPASWIPENCAHRNITYSYVKPLTLLTDDTIPINSGVMIFNPSLKLSKEIKDFMLNNQSIVNSYVFPDQQLLQDVLKKRVRILPWKFNALKVLRVCHPNLWYDGASNKDVHVVHYIHEKPWSKRTKSIPIFDNLPQFDDLDVDPSHCWWWFAYDNYL